MKLILGVFDVMQIRLVQLSATVRSLPSFFGGSMSSGTFVHCFLH